MKHINILCVMGIAVLFFALSFFFFHDVRPTMLLQTFSIPPKPQVFWDEILPKKPFVFTFIANENNLGTIEVRFRSYKRQDNYALLFQLREQGTTTALYEHIYYLFPFEQERLFPFGFPVISESRGKHYEVTISSIGNKDIPVVVSHVHPSVTAKYYVPISQLKTQGAQAVLTFVGKKIVNTMTSWQFIRNAIFFLCPLGFFLYRFVFKMKQNESIVLTLITNVILFSSLGSMVITPGYLLGYIIVCFLVAKYVFGWFSEIPLIITLSCMIGAVVSLVVGKLMIAEQFAIWILPTAACYLFYALVENENVVGKTQINKIQIHTRSVVLFFAILLLGAGFVSYKHIRSISYIKPSETPIITYGGPTIMYNASYVLLKGSGFGSQYTGALRIMSTYGEIEETGWTNDAIVFRIPLSWTPGTFSVWMERNVGSHWIQVPNSEYRLKLLDKSKPWTEEDDDYYKQVIRGPKELLQVSEYTLGWYY